MLFSQVRSFFDYAKMFLDSERRDNALSEEVNKNLVQTTIVQDGIKRWEIAIGTLFLEIVTVSHHLGILLGVSDGEMKQMSFVNSIWTIRGGTHVGAIAEKIAKHLSPALKKKNKGEEIKPFFIKVRPSFLRISLAVMMALMSLV